MESINGYHIEIHRTIVVRTGSKSKIQKWFGVLQAALHIHLAKSHSGGDDFSHNPQGPNVGKDSHPLDSNFTCDVLR